MLTTAINGTTAFAQTWEFDSAVRELDRTVEGLGGVAALNEEDLSELSRLLASPIDQVRWLLKMADARRTPDPEEARKTLPLAERRLEEWRNRCARSDGDFASWCIKKEAVFVQLKKDIDEFRSGLPQTRLAAIVEPAVLAARLKAIEQKGGSAWADATPMEGFQLWARGVPRVMEITPRSALTVEEWEGWQVPAAVAAQLCAGAKPATLAGWERPLALSRSQPQQWKNEDKSSSDEKAIILQLHKVAAALLGSQMGMDGVDRGEPDTNDPSTWQKVADDAGHGNLWRLELLARWLQSLTSEPESAKSVAALAVNRYDATLKLVSPNVNQNIVLRALLVGISEGKPQALPPGLAYRNPARAARQQLSGEFKQLYQNNRQALNEAYALMQRIKASDVGLPPPQPSSVAELQQRFSNSSDAKLPAVHMLLEVLEVEGRYYGLATGSQNYTLLTGDAWRTELLEANDPAELLNLALWNKGGDKNAISVIIAPDGRMRSAEWYSRGDSIIRNRIDPTFFGASSDNTSSWVVYVPTTGILSKSDKSWTIDQAVRFWRLGQPSGGADDSFLSVRLGTCSKLPEYPCRPCGSIHVFDFGTGIEQAGSFLKLMQEVKKGVPAAAVGLR